MTQQTRHRYATVDGVDLFYREAGQHDAPGILLLHGFPSSSIQFRYLLADLSDRWHVVAPDLPGFDLSTTPERSTYSYTFDQLATTIAHLLDALSFAPVAVYLHDYGAQVGFRLMTRTLIRPAALIIQNSEIYEGEGWKEMSQMAARLTNPSDARERLRATTFTEQGIRQEFLEDLSAEVAERIDPSIIQLAWDKTRSPGVIEALLDLHIDYPANMRHYTEIQGYLRNHQPPTLVLWGEQDQWLSRAAAEAYRRDLPMAEVHILDGGHWLLESHGLEVNALVRRFLLKHLPAAPVSA